MRPATFEPDGDDLVQRYELPTGKVVTFRGADIRKERTGPHASVKILLGTFLLASDVFNLGRDPERVRLSNSAMRMMPEFDKEAWGDQYMKHALDLFCLGLWDAHVGQHSIELLEPSSENGVEKVCASYLIREGGTILFAPPGRGKSYTAAAMAVSMDAGCSKVWPVEQCKALYVNLERSRESMRFRLGRLNQALGLDFERPLAFLNARGRSLSDVYDSLKAGVQHHGCEVVVLDSLSRAGVGDLKEDTTGNRAVDLLNRLGVTWLALAHTPRKEEDHIFGSQMFDAGMDIGVQLLTQSTNGRTGIGLKVKKANDLAIPPMQTLALEWDDKGLVDIRPASKREFPELESEQKRPLADEIEEFLLLVGAMSATDIADELNVNRSQVSAILSSDSRFRSVKREGRSVLYGVISDRE